MPRRKRGWAASRRPRGLFCDKSELRVARERQQEAWNAATPAVTPFARARARVDRVARRRTRVSEGRSGGCGDAGVLLAVRDGAGRPHGPPPVDGRACLGVDLGKYRRLGVDAAGSAAAYSVGK